MIEKIPQARFFLCDFSFEMWFRYWLLYQPKVSTNFGFDFSIGPKPKYWFRSYTHWVSHCYLTTFIYFHRIIKESVVNFKNFDSLGDKFLFHLFMLNWRVVKEFLVQNTFAQKWHVIKFQFVSNNCRNCRNFPTIVLTVLDPVTGAR